MVPSDLICPTIRYEASCTVWAEADSAPNVKANKRMRNLRMPYPLQISLHALIPERHLSTVGRMDRRRVVLP